MAVMLLVFSLCVNGQNGGIPVEDLNSTGFPWVRCF